MKDNKITFNYREQQAFKAINLNGKGLEYGPLDKPMVPKENFDVKYADHLSESQLKEKYRNNEFVNLNDIVELDFITKNKPITEVIKHKEFDFILASHVIEHLPDLISFINQCLSLLTLGGVLSLIVPDKRYSFDINRRISTFSDIYAAYIEKRLEPSVRDICEHYFEVVKVSPIELWENSNSAVLKKYHSYEEAIKVASNALKATWNIDCHVWKFTYDSFLSLINECISHKLIACNIKYSCPPTPNEMEFYCSLEKSF